MPKDSGEKITGKTKKFKHQKWTAAEDAQLYKLLMGQYAVNWDNIAKLMYNKNARQCKDRWNYYLSPSVNNGDWTPEDDMLLNQKVKELGTKWKEISTYFVGRTNTNCKNRWLAMQREKIKNRTRDEINNQTNPAQPNIQEHDSNEVSFTELPNFDTSQFDFNSAFTDHNLDVFEL